LPKDALKTGNSPHFAELMLDAQRATVALDGVMHVDGSRFKAATMKDGRRVYSKLLDYQRTVCMTQSENAALQTAVDQIRARLRFLGQAV
jgi:hypothetical protein